jgi:HORMA domain
MTASLFRNVCSLSMVYMHACTHADEYQPPCFKAADAKAAAHFTRKPFTMDVGSVNTNHHNVGLKVNHASKLPA